MTPPGILPSPLRDKVGYSNHDRFRGHIPVHCCSGLQTPCLRFAMAVTGHHARLGTRLLAKLCRGRHSRRLGYMRLQGANRVAGGSRPPPAPSERSVRISRTTLFDSWFTALQEPATPHMGGAALVSVTASVL